MKKAIKHFDDFVARPHFLKTVHGIFFIGFLIQIPPAIGPWKDSVPYLVFLSVWAICYSALVGYTEAVVAARREQ